MKIAHFVWQGRRRWGIVELDDAVVLASDGPLDPVASDDVVPLADVDLLPPILPGAKIICIGLNYADHADETGATPPDEPLMFAKLPSSLVGPKQPITVPSLSDEVDFEAELGVVIGRRARNVTPPDALDHVYGYTCVNDVSARDLQLGDGQWTRGKSLDSFCPVGPWIVTRDEVPDPQALEIRCVLNGEVMQDSSTAKMIFGIAEVISFISQGITLEPGDLVATGTPAGVGFTRDPARYLRPGDVVRVEIEHVGSLENTVQRENPSG